MSIFNENISTEQKNLLFTLLKYLNKENKLIRGKLAVEKIIRENKIINGLLIIPCSISPIDLIIHLPAFCTEKKDLQIIYIDENHALQDLSGSKTLSCAYLIKKEFVPNNLMQRYSDIEINKNYF